MDVTQEQQLTPAEMGFAAGEMTEFIAYAGRYVRLIHVHADAERNSGGPPPEARQSRGMVNVTSDGYKPSIFNGSVAGERL